VKGELVVGATVHPVPSSDTRYRILVKQATANYSTRNNSRDNAQIPDEIELVSVFENHPPADLWKIMEIHPLAMVWHTEEGWVGNIRARELALTSAS
jgi:hypothetical protein